MHLAMHFLVCIAFLSPLSFVGLAWTPFAYFIWSVTGSSQYVICEPISFQILLGPSFFCSLSQLIQG